MINFSEYYDMIMEAKQPTFKQYVTEIFNDLKHVKNTYVKGKGLQFTNIDVEKANISLVNTTSSYDPTDDKDYNARIKFFNNYVKGIAAVIGIKTHPKMLSKGNRHVCEFPEDTLKNGIKVKYTSELNPFDFDGAISDNIEFTGKKSSTPLQTDFTQYPEWTPGKIIYSISGYSMTIVTFYKIIKRSGNTIYVRELAQKKDGEYSGKTVPVDNAFVSNDVLSGRLPNPKINREYVKVWDGKPLYYNELD